MQLTHLYTKLVSVKRWLEKRDTLPKIVCACWFGIAVFNTANVSAITLVRYPQPESATDERASYPAAILQMCARRSGNAFAVTPSDFHAQQGRNIHQLLKNDGIDVIWAVADKERERELLPVYVPIDRGLIGWRLLLIRDHDKAWFEQIGSVTDLAQLVAGQGHDWPDVAVLRANGFRVETSTTYEGLFHMLKLGHIQYFPRSLSEIWPELDAHQQLGLAVQDSLVMYYRSGLYFFVNINNAALASMLTSCLQSATHDGALRALFNEYYGAAIRRADLPHRRIIALQKPVLATDLPLLPAEYWFDPAEIAQ